MLFVLVAFAQLLVKAELLYDLSFSSDKFSDGAILKSDGTIHTPSRVSGIEIVYGYGGQEGNWAKLNTEDECRDTDTMIFDFNAKAASIEFDMYWELNGKSNVLNIYADPGPLIKVRNGSLIKDDLYDLVIGEIKDRTRHHVEFYFSWNTNVASVSLDGKIVHTESVDPLDIFYGDGEDYEDPEIELFAIDMESKWGDNFCDDIVALSNIKISEMELSEPELGMLIPSIQITERDEIPDEGGRIRYKAAIESTYANSDKNYIFWLSITLPSGLQYPVKRRHRKTLPASEVFDASHRAKIPGWVPAGSYQLTLVVINAENGDITNATSPFVKLSVIS